MFGIFRATQLNLTYFYLGRGIKHRKTSVAKQEAAVAAAPTPAPVKPDDDDDFDLFDLFDDGTHMFLI